MNVLDFEPKIRMCGAKRVRRGCFVQRSHIARNSICYVANAVREALGSLIGPVRVRAIEPRIPSAQMWNVLLSGAQLHHVRGSANGATFVLRPGDALALAMCAFGETPQPVRRDLSAVEQRTLQRIIIALTPALAPLCGQDVRVMPESAGASFTSYFELKIDTSAPLRLGIALAAEPAAAPASGGLALADLGEAAVELSAELASGAISGRAFLDLRPGTVVPMKTKIGEPGSLKLGDAAFARGVCGAAGSRYALILG